MKESTKKLSTYRKIFLTTKKKGVIIRNVATSPSMKRRAYSSSLIKKATMRSGVASEIERDGYPKIYVITKRSNKHASN